MDIADAFTEEAISDTDTNVSGDEENELRQMIKQLYASNQMDQTQDDENVAVLCFVAGRAYQAVNQRMQVSMSREMVGEFMEFLVQRGVT